MVFSSHSYQPLPSARKEMRRKSYRMIPFYLYPLESFPSFWGPQSSCDHSKMLTEKHDGYIYAIQAMKRHPWRTFYPHEAKLAILPLSLDVYSYGEHRPKPFLPGVTISQRGGGCPTL